MTYKERTLQACKEIAYKYRHPEDREFFTHSGCALCKIYFTGYDANIFSSCKGCFMANEIGKGGCFTFRSFIKAEHAWLKMTPYLERTFEMRAVFFDNMLEQLQKFPAKKFTPTGWSYFEKISRDL